MHMGFLDWHLGSFINDVNSGYSVAVPLWEWPKTIGQEDKIWHFLEPSGIESTLPSHHSMIMNSFEHEDLWEKRKSTRVKTPWRTSLHPTDRIWSQYSFPGSQVASWWSAHAMGTHWICFPEACFYLRPHAEMEKNSQCSLEIAEGLGLRWSTSYDARLLVPIIYVNFVFACECRHVCAKVHIWKLGTTLGVVPHHQRWLKQGLLFIAVTVDKLASEPYAFHCLYFLFPSNVCKIPEPRFWACLCMSFGKPTSGPMAKALPHWTISLTLLWTKQCSRKAICSSAIKKVRVGRRIGTRIISAMEKCFCRVGKIIVSVWVNLKFNKEHRDSSVLAGIDLTTL